MMLKCTRLSLQLVKVETFPSFYNVRGGVLTPTWCALAFVLLIGWSVGLGLVLRFLLEPKSGLFLTTIVTVSKRNISLLARRTFYWQGGVKVEASNLEADFCEFGLFI